MHKTIAILNLVALPFFIIGCAVTRIASDWSGPAEAQIDRDFIECQEKAYKIVGHSPGWGGTPYYTWTSEKEGIVESCMKSKGYKLK